MKCISVVSALILLSGIASCRKEFINPNAPRLDEVLKTSQGQVLLVVGIKNRFAVNSIYGNGSVFSAITANGFTTNEILLKAGGNQDFGQLSSGRNNIATNNTVLTDLWANCLEINNHCTMLLDNVDAVVLDSGLNINIKKYAYLYKSMTIGIMANYWDSFPVSTGKEASFVNRIDALKMAISMLETASSLPAKTPPLEFGTEIDLQNTMDALQARYNIMLGNYDQAITKASKVNLKSRSVFIFNAQNPNPVFRSGFTAVFGYTANGSPSGLFGLPPSLQPNAADGRIVAYLNGSASTGYGFAKSDGDPLPIFLPGEMLLIQAEAFVKKGDLTNGKKFLDSVLRKKNSEDVFGIGANLPAYSGLVNSASLLQEIYRNRCIELFMSGMKLEDSRRFQRPGPKDANAERNRNFYPYPLQERSGNPNTPKDPDN